MVARLLIVSLVAGFIIVCGGSSQLILAQSSEKVPDMYLGQKPPGLTPEPFAAEILLNGTHSSPSFSPSGLEVYWSRYYTPEGRRSRIQHIFFSRLEGGQWTAPQVAPFSGVYSDGSPSFSLNGRRLFFASNRPAVEGGEPSDEYVYDIWCTERADSGWGEPHRLAFNSDKHESNVTVAGDGTLYFMSNRAGARGTFDIFVAEPIGDSGYTTPKNIGSPITSANIEFSPCIAPDESYIVFSYRGRPEGDGLHISYRQDDGSWSLPVKLSATINAPSFNQRFPGLSHDGRYFFFSREAQRERRIYWVDAKVLEQYRPLGQH